MPDTCRCASRPLDSVSVRGDVSSQFLSGLLLAAPCMRDGLVVEVTTELVSVPYVEMTLSVMTAFGARVVHDVDSDGRRTISVESGGYRAVERYVVEPDASAASYFFAAAAICGGTVRVDGLGMDSLQGDVAFVDALEQMGCQVERAADHLTVVGASDLRGVEVDFTDISDTAQTLAVVAPFASSPTTITGIGFIRGKETDRIAAVVAELRRCGISAEELPDGIRVAPGAPQPAVVDTYDDHRMAMSFALLGLRAPGIVIRDPGCVAKTFPGYWTALEGLRRTARS
jgi:3-phosphoshikimate 1-carboxyvinyltransferase